MGHMWVTWRFQCALKELLILLHAGFINNENCIIVTTLLVFWELRYCERYEHCEVMLSLCGRLSAAQ